MIGQLVAIAGVIAGAIAVQTRAAFTKSWAVKADLNAPPTPEAVVLVVW